MFCPLTLIIRCLLWVCKPTTHLCCTQLRNCSFTEVTPSFPVLSWIPGRKRSSKEGAVTEATFGGYKSKCDYVVTTLSIGTGEVTCRQKITLCWSVWEESWSSESRSLCARADQGYFMLPCLYTDFADSKTAEILHWKGMTDSLILWWNYVKVHQDYLID